MSTISFHSDAMKPSSTTSSPNFAVQVSTTSKKGQEVEGSCENDFSKSDATTESSVSNEKDLLSCKRKIKELEDEIESYEDDIDDLNKKLKKQKIEVGELEEQLRMAYKKNSNLEAEISATVTKLDSSLKALETKEEALSFVQDVLQAKKASDGKELEAAVDRFVDFIKGELSDVLKDTSNLRIEESKLLRWSSSAKKTWLKNKITIAFVGEFSAGKTSIVNRILSQDDKSIPLLPVSTKATTAIPTYISSGIRTSYQFYSPDNILKSISETTFKRVTKEVLSQVEGLSSLITYFVMKYKNPNLEKLSILDTPGFNSNDSEDSRRTIEVINECDALFWVFDVNAGTINRSSLKVIKEHLKKPLYIIINKVDTKSDREVDSVEKLIKKTIESEGIIVNEYIRFSSNSKYKLDAIMNPIRNVVRITSKDEFINELENNIVTLRNEAMEHAIKSNSSYNNIRKKHDAIVKKHYNVRKKLFDACVQASYIPHHKTYFFKDDNYVMNKDEYNHLDRLLEDIATQKSYEMTNLFDQSKEIVEAMDEAFYEKCNHDQSVRKLIDILEKFQKYNNAYQQALLQSSNKKTK